MNSKELESKRFAGILKNEFLQIMEQEKSYLSDHKGIKELAKLIRMALVKVDTTNLEMFARDIGIDCVLKTPLIATSGGVVAQLSNKRRILLYYSILPMSARYTLAHEIGHVVLGHLTANEGKRTLKDGLKCEWGAETFASNLTRVPIPVAMACFHTLAGFLSYPAILYKPFLRKRELEKIMKQLGNNSSVESEVEKLLKEV